VASARETLETSAIELRCHRW